MYDIIIVGAGPAGLTAAIYGRRSNKKVIVFEALSYGGIDNLTVPALTSILYFLVAVL